MYAWNGPTRQPTARERHNTTPVNPQKPPPLGMSHRRRQQGARNPQPGSLTPITLALLCRGAHEAAGRISLPVPPKASWLGRPLSGVPRNQGAIAPAGNQPSSVARKKASARIAGPCARAFRDEARQTRNGYTTDFDHPRTRLLRAPRLSHSCLASPVPGDTYGQDGDTPAPPRRPKFT